MPVQTCKSDGKPGWKWGDSGTCYTFTEGDDASSKAAKKKAIKQALAIGGGKLPNDVSGAASKAVKRMAGRKLKTRDLKGVEIMAAGAKVYGTGDADPEGETYSVEELEAIAKASNEAADLLAPLKIGHSKEQRLLANSGLSIDEEPAAGWVTNFRVKGEKLLADVKRVPETIAALTESGAFRTRSPEIGPWHDQENDRSYPSVVRGLALLGTTPPAFQTLDDVVKAYSADGDTAALILADEEPDEPDVKVAHYAAGDVVWDSEKGSQDVMSDLCLALDPSAGGENRPPKYWVRDLMFTQSGGKALVNDSSNGYDSAQSWVIPFSFNADGDPVPADRSTWILAQEAWVEAASGSATTTASAAPTANSEGASYSGAPGSRAADDTSRQMADEPNKPDGDGDGQKDELDLNEEQRGVLRSLLDFFTAKPDGDGKEPDLTKLEPEIVKTFAAAAGVPDETDPAKVLEAMKGKAEPVKPEGDDRIPDGMVLFAADEKKRLEDMAAQGVEANAELKRTKRDNFLRNYARQGRISPAEMETWGSTYDDLGEERTKEIIERLPVDESIVRTYGAEGAEDADREAMGEEAYYAYCAASGLPYEGRLNQVKQ